MGEHKRQKPSTLALPKTEGVTLWISEPEMRRYKIVYGKLERDLAGQSCPSFAEFLSMLCREGFRSVIRQAQAQPERRLVVTPDEAARQA